MKPPEKEKAAPSPLAAEAKRRLQRARRQKSQFEIDMREGYFFAAPHRMRSVSSLSKPLVAKPQDAIILNTSFGFELCEDFPTVIINTFMPETSRWVVRRATSLVPPEQRAQVNAAAEEQDQKVFDEIKASNFYTECGKAFNPDLALGTVGLWIEQPKAYEPPVVQAIPIRELEINIGPDGNVDDRFVIRHTCYGYLPSILKGVSLPAEINAKVKDEADKQCIVSWGFWRVYDDTDDEQWQHTVMVDGKLVKQAKLKGAGCCPLVIARFGATPEWSWGVGPLIKGLPDLRALDELAAKKIKNIDMSLDPPISYPDGSFANIQDGIEPGMAYAIRPGEEGAIKSLYDPPSINPAIYFSQDMEQRLRRLFFLDWPQQRGDTPPTATQWLDEMTLAQRRIGTPGLVFWRECCAAVFQRFLYLMEKGGQVEPIMIETQDGEKRPAALMPRNPAQRAADQEEVALFTRFAEIGTAAFPEEWKLETDGSKTLSNIAEKMGVAGMWARRDPKQVAGAIKNISQLMGGTAPGAPALPNGAPPPADMAGPAPNQPTYSIQGQGL